MTAHAGSGPRRAAACAGCSAAPPATGATSSEPQADGSLVARTLRRLRTPAVFRLEPELTQREGDHRGRCVVDLAASTDATHDQTSRVLREVGRGLRVIGTSASRRRSRQQVDHLVGAVDDDGGLLRVQSARARGPRRPAPPCGRANCRGPVRGPSRRISFCTTAAASITAPRIIRGRSAGVAPAPAAASPSGTRGNCGLRHVRASTSRQTVSGVASSRPIRPHSMPHKIADRIGRTASRRSIRRTTAARSGDRPGCRGRDRARARGMAAAIPASRRGRSGSAAPRPGWRRHRARTAMLRP